ncbi:MAG TPA: acetyl-CoA hydrolase/transferase C-terminal domain-containing protein [Candidatus Bathyarchaeia archaeon]|nr:acetyl-CoA hydrolase/transferase C-terminal domain-containing protein [Candidatus Bathyarchaeia archaeon]
MAQRSPGSKAEKLDLEAAARLVRPCDTLLCGFVAGQPAGFLEALGARSDLEDVVIYTGLLMRPYTLLQNPGVRVVSGFFGPVERMARAAGGRVSYLPADFNGLEQRALRMKPRVALAVTSPPDRDGFLSFGLQAGASYRPFLEAARDPDRLAIAEVNPLMPRVDGLPELGRNRIHISEVDAWVEHATELVTLPQESPSQEELAIARLVCDRIEPGATLQFGIGTIPDEIARILAERRAGGYGIHTEMISDGVMRLHGAGKVANRKPVYPGFTVATFALGSDQLYRWLDGNPEVRMLPVTDVNGPTVLEKLVGLTSINGALSIDLAGQVAADSIGSRQHSGTGGHESFVSGAASAPGGRTFLCLKSTANVGGKRISTIVPSFSDGTRVTTPRHHVQYVVTEHGAVDLSLLSDEERPEALIEIADPEFREALRRESR